MSTSRETPCI